VGRWGGGAVGRWGGGAVGRWGGGAEWVAVGRGSAAAWPPLGRRRYFKGIGRIDQSLLRRSGV
jgi:hypothetical protein